MLATIRSHDQYNTTIYGFNDRYRGITGRRDVIFMHQDDLKARGLNHGDLVDVEAIADCGRRRQQHARIAQPHRGRVRDRQEFGSGLLPGSQSARRAAELRRTQRHAGVQVDPRARARGGDDEGRKRSASWRTPCRPRFRRSPSATKNPASAEAGFLFVSSVAAVPQRV